MHDRSTPSVPPESAARQIDLICTPRVMIMETTPTAHSAICAGNRRASLIPKARWTESGCVIIRDRAPHCNARSWPLTARGAGG